MGKNSLSYFCNCLTRVQAGVRPIIVVKEKDIFHVLFRMNSTDVLLQFVLHFLLPLMMCALKSRQGNLQNCYTASYSTLAKVC
jgi:hypothetical protein